MLDQSDPRLDQHRSTARPLKWVAICICVGVVSFFVGINTLCGPGSGAHGRDFVAVVAIILFFGSVIGVVGCFIWFLLNVIYNRL